MVYIQGAMATKMKGLLKGLRYISQKLDNEKEPDIVIGLPTDVKHVAHIGWEGPSVDSPSWMNEFKPPGGGPDSRESVSEEVLKPTKRQSITSTSTSTVDSPTKIKTEKHRSSRRASSKASLGRDVPEVTPDSSARPSVELEAEESPRKKQQPDHAPKRSTTRKKKPSSKDGVGPPRSASRLSVSKAAQQMTSDPPNDNNKKKKDTSQVASLRDEERCENQRGQGNGTVS